MKLFKPLFSLWWPAWVHWHIYIRANISQRYFFSIPACVSVLCVFTPAFASEAANLSPQLCPVKSLDFSSNIFLWWGRTKQQMPATWKPHKDCKSSFQHKSKNTSVTFQASQSGFVSLKQKHLHPLLLCVRRSTSAVAGSPGCKSKVFVT